MLNCELFIIDAEKNTSISLSKDKHIFSCPTAITFYEEKFYSVSIKLSDCTISEIENVRFYICEEEIMLIHKINTKDIVYEIDFDNHRYKDTAFGNHKIFSLLYNSVCFTIAISLKNNEELLYYSGDYSCIFKDDLNSDNINAILLTLIDCEDKISNILYKDSNKLLLSGSNLTASFNNTIGYKRYLGMIDKIIHFLSHNYNYFLTNSAHRIKSYSKIQKYENAREISVSDFTWLKHNLEQLCEVNFHTNIQINGKYYLPVNMQSQIMCKTFNIYENVCIFAFINDVYLNLKNLSKSYEKIVFEYRNKILYINNYTSKNWYLIRSQTLLDIFERRLKKIQDLTSIINLLYWRYRDIFAIKQNINLKFNTPRKTKIFQEMPIYIKTYNLIIEWLNLPKYDNKVEKALLTNIKLDKIYEYFCLQKIIDTLISNRFALISNNSVFSHNYSLNTYEEDSFVNNTFLFSDEKYNVTLFYQPILFPNKTENALTLYKATQGSYFNPDFIIKVNCINSKKTGYIIIDAKFSKFNTLKTYDVLSKTLNKYYFEIGDVNSISSSYIGIGLFHGRPSQNGQFNFHNSVLSNQFKHLPLIFINPVNIENMSCTSLWNDLLDYFKMYFI